MSHSSGDVPKQSPDGGRAGSPRSGAGSERDTEALQNIRVVLVDPQCSGNIGASARAMMNMGLTDLRLVFSGRPTEHVNAEARKMAMYAKDMLFRAPVYANLAEAVADCALVVGATRRQGKFRHVTVTAKGIAERILQSARRRPVALVFGPENFGLSNEHLRSCHELTFIPAHSGFGSLNLAMAVLIICYEVYQVARSGAEPPDAPASSAPVATAEELAGLFGHMKDTLLRIDFLDPQNPERMMTHLRRLFSRADLSFKDVKVLRGIFRQVNWALGEEEFKSSADAPAASALEEEERSTDSWRGLLSDGAPEKK
ncbi:MAG: RNA methyltransferase [Nitrospinota bacterium]|nr:RNA methyltransferase [Nitrospinota bacterium]